MSDLIHCICIYVGTISPDVGNQTLLCMPCTAPTWSCLSCGNKEVQPDVALMQAGTAQLQLALPGTTKSEALFSLDKHGRCDAQLVHECIASHMKRQTCT